MNHRLRAKWPEPEDRVHICVHKKMCYQCSDDLCYLNRFYYHSLPGQLCLSVGATFWNCWNTCWDLWTVQLHLYLPVVSEEMKMNEFAGRSPWCYIFMQSNHLSISASMHSHSWPPWLEHRHQCERNCKQSSKTKSSVTMSLLKSSRTQCVTGSLTWILILQSNFFMTHFMSDATQTPEWLIVWKISFILDKMSGAKKFKIKTNIWA